MNSQLREAAERWKTFSSNDYYDGHFSQDDDAVILATYAAEQLTVDGWREDFIALKNATETLILILGMTAIKYPGQLAVLQEAVDMVKKVLKAHSTTTTTITITLRHSNHDFLQLSRDAGSVGQTTASTSTAGVMGGCDGCGCDG